MSLTSESSSDGLAGLADNAALVLVTYGLILTPLALYVYHDILDARWRPVWRLVRFLIAYLLLYVIAGMGLVFYISVQVAGKDYKEVGASALALMLGTYGAWKLARLARIILAHRDLVRILQRIDAALCKLTGLKPVGLEYHLFRLPPTPVRGKKQKISHLFNRITEARHCFISSALFDDDYPGEAAARIRWLAFFGKKIIVLREDADECASRVALWMRLVLRRPRSEPWKLLTSTSPLVQGHLYCISLGEALRDLMTYGSHEFPPGHATRNPAQALLNKGRLTKVGIGFFWICSEMGSEEMSQVLAEMPPRWMRGVTQNGKQLVFEIVMSLILCEMPHAGDSDLEWFLSLPVLTWARDVKNLRVWSVMADICADAVVCCMPKYTYMGEMPDEALTHDTVRKGVFELREATSQRHGFQGDTIGLSLIELIRAAYRAGYLTEQILGRELQKELKRNDWTDSTKEYKLFKAEIVIGLYSILSQLGQTQNDAFRDMFALFKTQFGLDDGVTDVIQAMQERAKKEMQESYGLDIVSKSRYWFFVERKRQCDDPLSAFATVSAAAAELAPFVVQMISGYVGHEHVISFDSSKQGDPEVFREKWLAWKQRQAFEIGGSTEALYTNKRRNEDDMSVSAFDVSLDIDEDER